MAYQVEIRSKSTHLTSNTPPASAALPHNPTPQSATRSSSRFIHDDVDELSKSSIQLIAGSRDAAVANSDASSSGSTPFQRASRDDTTQSPSAQLFDNLDNLTPQDQEKIRKGPSKQEILSHATKLGKERSNCLPICYAKSGKLKQPWFQIYGAEFSEIRNGMNVKPPTQDLKIEEPPKPKNVPKQLTSAGVLALSTGFQHPQNICQICRTPLKASRKGQKLCSACPKSTSTTPAASGHVLKIRNPHRKDDGPMFPNLVLQPDEQKSRKRLPRHPSSDFVPDTHEAQAQYGVELRAPTASPITLNGSSPRHHQHENSLEAITVSAAPARRKSVSWKFNS